MYAISTLLSNYKQSRYRHTPAQNLRFILKNGRLVGTHYEEMDPVTGEVVKQTVYNCSKPYRNILAVRQDPLNSECGCVILAKRHGEFWALTGPRILNAQDPSIMVVDGQPILTYNKYEMDSQKKITSVHQYFCHLHSPDQPFAIGQTGAKGGRLMRRIKGRIPVMGRKQNWSVMRGQLTYTEIDSLDELEDALKEAPIVQETTDNNSWVGANELIQLGRNTENIGVFLHIAELNEEFLAKGVELKSYYAAVGIFNLAEQRMIEMEIILDAEDLPFTKYTKMDQLRNVIYPGGLVPDKKTPGVYTMYGGANDFLCFRKKVSIDLLRQYML